MFLHYTLQCQVLSTVPLTQMRGVLPRDQSFPQLIRQRLRRWQCMQCVHYLDSFPRIDNPFQTNRIIHLVHGTDIPVQELCPFIHAHAHYREVWLGPANITLHIQNKLLLQPERQINAMETLRISGSYTGIAFVSNTSINAIGGSKGGAPGTRPPPPGVQILSFSCSFRQKFEK